MYSVSDAFGSLVPVCCQGGSVGSSALAYVHVSPALTHPAALMPPLDQAYRQSALTADAMRKLDADLVSGHCGKLPERYLAPMRLVQRATAISMANQLKKKE